MYGIRHVGLTHRAQQASIGSVRAKKTTQQSGCINAEREQSVLLLSQGYRVTDGQKLFQDSYARNTPRSIIRRWHYSYRTRGSHKFRRGNGAQELVMHCKM